MLGTANETVGDPFQLDLLRQARDKTLQVIEKTAARITPGMTEKEAKRLIAEIQSEMGGPRSWHPPQIRFGENTLLPFGKPGKEDVRLAENDIFFFDIGPIFEGHEGDVGRPFALGNDAEKLKCCRDAAEIWHAVRNHWKSENVSGGELYEFAKNQAEARGWRLALEKANGHRIADFPHAVRTRGSIEGFDGKPAPDRWILEIQIRHPNKPFGAFYEDLLN